MRAQSLGEGSVHRAIAPIWARAFQPRPDSKRTRLASGCTEPKPSSERRLSGPLRLARLGRSLHLIEAASLDVVDVAIDRHVRGNQRMLADAAHVLCHARFLILYRL